MANMIFLSRKQQNKKNRYSTIYTSMGLENNNWKLKRVLSFDHKATTE